MIFQGYMTYMYSSEIQVCRRLNFIIDEESWFNTLKIIMCDLSLSRNFGPIISLLCLLNNLTNIWHTNLSWPPFFKLTKKNIFVEPPQK